MASSLSRVARASDFGAEAAGHPFGDITRARVSRAVVLRAADHRLLILVRTARVFLRRHVIFGPRLRADIAEYT